MEYSVNLALKAQTELFESWSWYEDIRRGLGDEFETEVFLKIDQVQNNPFHYPLKGKVRQAVADVFPYLIVYRIVERQKLIIILSIFHTSRHPRKKY